MEHELRHKGSTNVVASNFQYTDKYSAGKIKLSGFLLKAGFVKLQFKKFPADVAQSFKPFKFAKKCVR